MGAVGMVKGRAFGVSTVIARTFGMGGAFGGGAVGMLGGGGGGAAGVLSPPTMPSDSKSG